MNTGMDPRGQGDQGGPAGTGEWPGLGWRLRWRLAGAEKRRSAFVALATSSDPDRDQWMRGLLALGLWQDIDRVDNVDRKHERAGSGQGTAMENLAFLFHVTFANLFEDFKLSQQRGMWRRQMSQAAHRVIKKDGSASTVALLVEGGLDPTWREGNSYDDTLLMAAVRRGRADLVALLCQAGCDVENVDSCMETPLKIALWTGRNPERGSHAALAIIDALLEQGADINGFGAVRDGEERRQTPLFYACLHNDLATIKHLVGKGARVDCQTQMGRGVLHALAAPPGREEIASHLIGLGAGVNLQDEHGVSPLAMAVMERNAELAMVLLKAGADPRLTDHTNQQFPGACVLHHLVSTMDPANEATMTLVEAIHAKYADCWQWTDESGCSVAELAQSMTDDPGRRWRALFEQAALEQTTDAAPKAGRRALRI